MSLPSSENIFTFPDPTAVAEDAARRFITLAKEAIAARNKFTVALSGGTTPKAMYGLLAGPYAQEIEWEKVYLFWGDERFVAHDHSDSTYLMVKNVLLGKVVIPSQNIFAIPTNYPLQEVATRYTRSLVDFFKNPLPQFDLVILGMGADGHTASLFPYSATLHSTELVAIELNSPKSPSKRITLTHKIINNAAHIMFLVTGKDKTNALKNIMSKEKNIEQFPAQGVQPMHGKMVWLVDEGAAAEIKYEQ